LIENFKLSLTPDKKTKNRRLVKKFIEIIQSSTEPEFESLRQIISEKRKLKKEDLERHNPFLFIKATPCLDADYSNNITIKDNSNISKKLMINDYEIHVN
jgi:hypothetical protein